jgi:hypothetical protein
MRGALFEMSFRNADDSHKARHMESQGRFNQCMWTAELLAQKPCVSETTESITGEQEGNAVYERLKTAHPHALSTPRDEDEVLECLHIVVVDEAILQLEFTMLS